MREKILNLTLCIALLVALVAFTPPVPVAAQGSPELIRVGLISPIDRLDPLFIGNTSELFISEQLFLGLTGVDSKGNLVPELAQSWQVSDDGLRWTFNLRKEVPWVDANNNYLRDVNSTDVSFTFDRARQFGNFEEILQSVERMDDYTVMFFLRTPIADFGNILAVSPAAKIVPFDLVEKMGDAWAQPGNIWADGPYRLMEQQGSSVRLEVNTYLGEGAKAQIRAAWVEYIPDQRQALQFYMRGDLDLIELNFDFRGIVAQDPVLSERIRDTQGTKLDFYSRQPYIELVSTGHSYLPKPSLLPVLSDFFGLDGIHLWGFDLEVPSIEIPDTTRVLNDESLAAMQSMSDDQSVLVFGWTAPQLNLIFEGDIIVGDSTLRVGNSVAPFGFLRRVTRTYVDASGLFVIETVPASLEEAVTRGSLSQPVPLNFDNIYSEEGTTQTYSPQGELVLASYMPPYSGLNVGFDTWIYDANNDGVNDNDQIRVKGNVNVAQGSGLKMDIDIQGHQLQYFNISTTVLETANIELYSNVNLVSFDRSIDLKRITFAPATFFIGPMPVVITPQLAISVGVNGKISIGISAGIEQSSTITTGASYKYGSAWNTSFNISDNHIGPLETDLTQTAKAGVYAGPNLSVTLYGIAGPYAKIKAYLTLSGDPTADPLWTLVGGIVGELGIKIQVLSFYVSTDPFKLPILPEQVLAQQGKKITPPTDIPPASVTPSPSDGDGISCKSIWWPIGCWTWWIWVIVIVLVIVALFMIFG